MTCFEAICDALRDLVPVTQFLKSEKHPVPVVQFKKKRKTPMVSVTFRKVVLLHGCFSCFFKLYI